jgi:hypothetical protein
MEKTLTHGQQVKVASWKYEPHVVVGTIEGYAKKCNESITEALARECRRCIKQGCKPMVAWVVASAACITADYKGKAEAIQKAHDDYAAAVELSEREVVVIEGIRYFVHINDKDGIRYSNPIEFQVIPEYPDYN